MSGESSGIWVCRLKFPESLQKKTEDFHIPFTAQTVLYLPSHSSVGDHKKKKKKKEKS